MLYAAQFRDMHTACHMLAVYKRRMAARDALGRMEGRPWDCTHPDACLEVIKIDYRKPPTTYKGEPLKIVNTTSSGVPDVY